MAENLMVYNKEDAKKIEKSVWILEHAKVDGRILTIVYDYNRNVMLGVIHGDYYIKGVYTEIFKFVAMPDDEKDEMIEFLLI